MERSGWIGRDKLNLHLPSVSCVRASVGRAQFKNGAHHFRVMTGVNKKVNKAWACDIAAVDQGVIRERLNELRGEITGGHADPLCQHHRDIAGEIAMARILGPINLRRDIGQLSQCAL